MQIRTPNFHSLIGPKGIVLIGQEPFIRVASNDRKGTGRQFSEEVGRSVQGSPERQFT